MKSTIKLLFLLVALSFLLITIGDKVGGRSGIIMALGMSLVSQGIAFFFSDKIALAMNGAKELNESEAPKIYSMVRRLTQRAELPMPKIYLSPEPSPNAFATGRDPAHSAVAVTQGLLNALDDNEVEAVLAHELGHIKNRDVFISTVAAVLASAISSLSHFAYMFSSGRDREEGGTNPIVFITMLIVAPIAAMIIQMAISRSREYEADAAAAEMMGTPMPLARALEKIHNFAQNYRPSFLKPAYSSLYIANPFSGEGLKELLSTHPPMEKRIDRLLNR